jgi:hypothetical protein
MTQLPTVAIATRLNALAAAAIVTLALLAGIDTLAAAETAAPQWAQGAVTQPA